MAPVLSRSLATASLVSLPFSFKHPNNKHLNLRSSLFPQNGLRKGFSCSALNWDLQKRNNRPLVRCEAAVAEKEAADTSGEKFEYQAEVGLSLFFDILWIFYFIKACLLLEIISFKVI